MTSVRVLRAVWDEFLVPLEERTRILGRYETLIRGGCSESLALRSVLDDWSNRCVNVERRFGHTSSYRNGFHWERVQALCQLLAGGLCEVTGCSRSWPLEIHHHHYESVGWESLFALSVVCRDCHRKLSHGAAYIERELRARREDEQQELTNVLAGLGEQRPRDGLSVSPPPDLIL
jgi:hypothetical protein